MTMNAMASADAELHFPWPEPPPGGEVREVAPGLLWLRIPLPFRLDHVNVYLIADGTGWAIVDTGIADDAARGTWDALLAGPLAGWTFTRLIVTHHDPDHIGLAGWLCGRLGIPLLTSQGSYFNAVNMTLDPGAFEAAFYQDFYRRHGMAEEALPLVAEHRHEFCRAVAPLPPSYRRLHAGDELVIGARRFEVLVGEGHAPEVVMLYCAAEELLLASDQVIAKISPNISVWAVEPDGDPLGLYLSTLAALERRVSPGALVLAGHQLPFHGLHQRCRELAAHHRIRCDLVVDACRGRPKTVAELVPVLFTRPLDRYEVCFAFSEALAHVNHMVGQGWMAWHDKGGERRLHPV